MLEGARSCKDCDDGEICKVPFSGTGAEVDTTCSAEEFGWRETGEAMAEAGLGELAKDGSIRASSLVSIYCVLTNHKST